CSAVMAVGSRVQISPVPEATSLFERVAITTLLPDGSVAIASMGSGSHAHREPIGSVGVAAVGTTPPGATVQPPRVAARRIRQQIRYILRSYAWGRSQKGVLSGDIARR